MSQKEINIALGVGVVFAAGLAAYVYYKMSSITIGSIATSVNALNTAATTPPTTTT